MIDWRELHDQAKETAAKGERKEAINLLNQAIICAQKDDISNEGLAYLELEILRLSVETKDRKFVLRRLDSLIDEFRHLRNSIVLYLIIEAKFQFLDFSHSLEFIREIEENEILVGQTDSLIALKNLYLLKFYSLMKNEIFQNFILEIESDINNLCSEESKIRVCLLFLIIKIEILNSKKLQINDTYEQLITCAMMLEEPEISLSNGVVLLDTEALAEKFYLIKTINNFNYSVRLSEIENLMFEKKFFKFFLLKFDSLILQGNLQKAEKTLKELSHLFNYAKFDILLRKAQVHQLKMQIDQSETLLRIALNYADNVIKENLVYEFLFVINRIKENDYCNRGSIESYNSFVNFTSMHQKKEFLISKCNSAENMHCKCIFLSLIGEIYANMDLRRSNSAYEAAFLLANQYGSTLISLNSSIAMKENYLREGNELISELQSSISEELESRIKANDS